MIVDPPGGWRYGFPQPRDFSMTYEEQLIKNRYPLEDIPLALKWSRYWEHNDDE